MAYSLDFRQKVFDAYKNKEGSIRAIAERFAVSPGFVFDLLKLHKETGSLEKRPHGGGQTDKLKEADGYEKLRTLYEEQNDLTDMEYRDLLEERYNINVSDRTVNRAWKRMKITRKKNVSR